MQRTIAAATGRSAALIGMIGLALISLAVALMFAGTLDAYTPITGMRRTLLALWLGVHGLLVGLFAGSNYFLPRRDAPVSLLLAAVLGASLTMTLFGFVNLGLAAAAIFWWHEETIWASGLAALAVLLFVTKRLEQSVEIELPVKDQDVIAMYAIESPRYRAKAIFGQFAYGLMFSVVLFTTFAAGLCAAIFMAAAGYNAFLVPGEPSWQSVGLAFETMTEVIPRFAILSVIIVVVAAVSGAFEAFKTWREPPEPP